MSGGKRAASRPPRRGGRIFGVLLLVLLGVAGLGFVGYLVVEDYRTNKPASSSEDPSGTGTGQRTPLASFDTTGLTLTRAPFCDQVAPAAIEAALTDKPDTTTAYGNGDQADLENSLNDVAHEYGCTWATSSGTRARAWVFAPAISPKRAHALADQARARTDCQVAPEADKLGRHSVALVCTDSTRLVTSYQGLVGTTWLSCSIEEPLDSTADTPADQSDALVLRTASWCLAVVQATANGASPAAASG